MVEPKRQFIAPIVLIAMIAIFLGVYFHVASKHALNADEGMYATAAMHFADGDLLLQKADTDKPPMVYHLQGIAILLFGRNDMAVKVPNAVALVALFLLVYGIGKRLFDSTIGLTAVLVVASSPFLGKCGIGAMTDPPAVAFLTAAFLMAIKGRVFWSGFLFGMAILTRQMALLYFPVLIAPIIWQWKKGEANIKAAAKSLVLGGIGPAGWLVIWSAFFEREKFRWLLQELFSGKVTLGAERAGFAERVVFWLKQMAIFPASSLVWIVAILCGIYFLLRHVKPESDQQKFALYLFAGATIYYPAIHTLMGAPLYRRMLFPLLPLAALLIAWLVVAAFRNIKVLNTGYAKIAAGFGLCLFFAWGMGANARELSAVHPRDDNPELAAQINQMNAGSSVLFTTDMNRELLFYLHGNKIKRKQFKKDPEKLKSLVPHYAGLKLLLALRQTESDLYDQIKNILSPQYRLNLLFKTSRELVELYEILPNAKKVMEADSVFYEYYQDGKLVRAPATLESAEKGLTRFAIRTLDCKEPKIKLKGDQRLQDGYLDSIDILTTNVKVRGIAVDQLSLQYQNVKFDWPQLLAVNQLVVREMKNAQATLVLSQEGLSAYLQKKNKNIKNMTATITRSGLKISGEVSAAGKRFAFEIEGTLSLDQKGGVWFAPNKGRLGDWNVPGFILGIVGRSINPAFTAKIEALNLIADEIKTRPGDLELILH